jgi:hypothetical protein
MEARPPGAPFCWSRQFDEADKECSRCEYRTSCKGAFFRANPVQSPSLPMYTPPGYQPPQPLWSTQNYSPSASPNPLVPMRTGVPTQQPPPPMFAGTAFPPPPPMTTAQPAMYGAPAVVNPPQVHPQQVHHLAGVHPSMMQQTPHFAQYYSPYAGETVTERLIKHILLRLGQVFFHEMSNFFGLWRWPPGGPPSSHK